MLPAGTRIGPYEIVAKLGAGGMGEVYRAHDAKLNRDVAIKVLPDLFATDPERLARLTREAQTLAALNHANIAHIYGVEGPRIRAPVMNSSTAGRSRRRRGPWPDEPCNRPPARRRARGRARTGHIHRDPAREHQGQTGRDRRCWTGLAKARPRTGLRTQDVSNSPTLTARATQMGMIMAPPCTVARAGAQVGGSPRRDRRSASCSTRC